MSSEIFMLGLFFAAGFGSGFTVAILRVMCKMTKQEKELKCKKR